MDKELVLQENYTLDEQKINTLIGAGIIPRGTPPAQITIFARIAAEKGLSPFSKQIYLVGYANNYSVITGIDGFRALAGRSRLHAGTDAAKYNVMADGSYSTAHELTMKNQKAPTTCLVTVYKIVGGQKVPFQHEAVFSEFSTSKQKWLTMPYQMIAKVAEAFALRKAFPEEISGILSEEEIGAFANENVPIVSESQIKRNEAESSPVVHSIEVIENSANWVADYAFKISKAQTESELIAIFRDAEQQTAKKAGSNYSIIDSDFQEIIRICTERKGEILRNSEQ